MSFYVINRTTGMRVERHRARENAERAQRVLTAHELAHKDCGVGDGAVERHDSKCSSKFFELLESSEPLFGSYDVVEAP